MAIIYLLPVIVVRTKTIDSILLWRYNISYKIVYFVILFSYLQVYLYVALSNLYNFGCVIVEMRTDFMKVV